MVNTVNISDISELIMLAESTHQQFLESIQIELDRRNIRDINDVRALMLLNIADAEMTVSELLWRGCYLGTNVSYNLKKLTEAGYVIQTRSSHDRRVVMVRNAPKGLELCEMLREMTVRRSQTLADSGLDEAALDTCRRTLKTLQRTWAQPLQRGPGVEPGFRSEEQGWTPRVAASAAAETGFGAVRAAG
jgi:DNA-binding MarR family transcriptional regulator